MRFIPEDAFLVPADSVGRNRMAERIKEKHGEYESQIIARSILSRPIEAIFVGEGKRYVTVFAAHHSLESITANIAYILADYLMTVRVGEKVCGIDCKLLLSKYSFIIVPCVNPDGVELRLNGVDISPLYDRQMKMSGGDFSRWQANARGVDLNHNYDYRFAEYKEVERMRGICAGASLYSGEYPESEPEVRGVSNLIRTLMPFAVVSLHSQGEEIFAFPSTARVRRIGERLSSMTGYTLSTPTDTAAYGGLCDFCGALGIPSFTLEVGKGKNPLPESVVPAVFERIGKAILLLPTVL